METLAEVEDAKALLLSAKAWSIVRWLAEKRRVRRVADAGTAALDELERKTKLKWSEELRNAYAQLTPVSADEDDPFAAAERQFAQQHATAIPDNIRSAASRVRTADDEAYHARMRAESTFDEAERRMSADLARRGADEAIRAYELRYKAIVAAESALES